MRSRACKRWALTFWGCFWGFLLWGQPFEPARVVLPEGQRPATLEDYLVQLAWQNHPANRATAVDEAIARQEVELERKKWHDEVRFTFNLNEVSLDNVLHPDPDNLIIYPLYQFSTSVSLGTFTNNRRKRRIAEQRVRLAELETQEQMLEVRKEVLTRYRQFRLAQGIYRVRLQAEEDARANHTLAQQQFKRGELPLEELNAAAQTFRAAQVDRLQAEADIELARYELEEILGVAWSSVERVARRMKLLN
ncbi:MAG: hypothetical protein D6765_02325 [Bacteroidetes bacterium]|nr:MAG: hypothetical protein D6765_02325 [Bacteroidota bacterium]